MNHTLLNRAKTLFKFQAHKNTSKNSYKFSILEFLKCLQITLSLI